MTQSKFLTSCTTMKQLCKLSWIYAIDEAIVSLASSDDVSDTLHRASTKLSEAGKLEVDAKPLGVYYTW